MVVELTLKKDPPRNHKSFPISQHPPSPDRLFANHSGYEVSMVDAACSVLGCTLEFVNPPDLSWGRLGDDRKWSGHVSSLINHRAGLALGTIGMYVQRNNVRNSHFRIAENV